MHKDAKMADKGLELDYNEGFDPRLSMQLLPRGAIKLTDGQILSDDFLFRLQSSHEADDRYGYFLENDDGLYEKVFADLGDHRMCFYSQCDDSVFDDRQITSREVANRNLSLFYRPIPMGGIPVDEPEEGALPVEPP